MPGSPDTLLILIKLLWANFGKFWMTKNFRDSKFFRAVDLLALDLESKPAWVFLGASHQVKVISALMANKLTAYRTSASIPLLFTNRDGDELPQGPTLPRWIASFLHNPKHPLLYWVSPQGQQCATRLRWGLARFYDTSTSLLLP